MNKEKQTGFHISKESVDKLFPKKDIDILGYESPITVIMGQMRMEQENNIYKAVQEYGVNVDKDELIKALQYDRDQYEKGYINGYNSAASEVARELFEELESIFYIASYTVRRPMGSLTTKPIDGIHMRLEDYHTIKKKYSEGEG